MEYQSIVADCFKEILEDNRTKPEEVLPLPWATSGTQRDQDRGRHTTQRFLPKTLVNFLKNVNADGQYTDASLKKLLIKLAEVTSHQKSMECKYDPNAYLMYSNKDKMLAMLFLRLHSSLDEGMYNATYIWLDQILSMTSPTHQLGYIVGDKMLTYNIEMFDILMYDEEHTYLVHAKEGFDQHVRDVCSQIRNSADLLKSALTSQSSHSFLEEMWETFSKEEDRSKKSLGKGNKKQDDDKLSSTAENTKSMKRYKETIRSKVNGIGKQKFKELFTGRRGIVYVLATRKTQIDCDILPAEDNSSILTALQRAYAGQSLTILKLLTIQGFVTNEMGKEYTLTDKFIIKKKQDFVSSMMKTTRSSKSQTISTGQMKPYSGTSRHEDSGYPETVGESEMTKTQTEASSTTYSGDEEKESRSEEETPKEADNIKFSNKMWEEVYDILRKSLPNTKSTIAQLEILSLFSHFRNYQIGHKKFQLKICFLSKSNKDLAKNLKAFLN